MSLLRIYLPSKLCICCHKNPITWPLVCDECRDHKTQAALALKNGIHLPQAPYAEPTHTTGMECRSYGMIHNGTLTCRYCGDTDPLDNDEADERYN